MGIMSTGMWGIAFSIVQTRMRKLLKQLVASPMRRRDYLVAQVLARLIFLLPEVAVPLAFGALVLGVPIRGTPWAIAAVSFVGALAFGGMALLAASRAKTFEAISGILNLSMLPMWVLGGVFFSASRFPASLQPMIQVLPLTALNNALRTVILEGSSLNVVRGELSLMAAWGLIPFAIALRVFRWR
jgi:ABC-type multidrug transport system permease subunit